MFAWICFDVTVSLLYYLKFGNDIKFNLRIRTSILSVIERCSGSKNPREILLQSFALTLKLDWVRPFLFPTLLYEKLASTSWAIVLFKFHRSSDKNVHKGLVGQRFWPNHTSHCDFKGVYRIKMGKVCTTDYVREIMQKYTLYSGDEKE